MYELKRKAKIEEQLKIGVEILTVSIDPEAIALQFNATRNKVITAEQKIKAVKDESGLSDEVISEYASAVTALFGLIFGESNALKIIDFYENRFVEMSTEVFPFIIDVITPKINRALIEMRETAAKQYKQKQAAKFGLPIGKMWRARS